MIISPARGGTAKIIIALAAGSILLFLWNYALPHYSNTIIHAENGGKAKPAGGEEEYKPGEFFQDAKPANASTTVELNETPPKDEIQEKAKKPSPTPLPVHEETATNTKCSEVKGADDVMIVLKTSAADIYDKLPEHLLTLFACAPHYAIFSDLAGTFSGHNVYDALENVTEGTRREHDEFKFYDKIQKYSTEAQHLSDLKGDSSKDLDKWKFLPMVYRAYKLRPATKFFVFIEDDTSLSWTNLLQWLSRLDSRIPLYAGAPSNVGDLRFAQRGGGYLISNAAMKLYTNAYEQRYASKWEKRTASECCGDVMLAIALDDAHVEFYSAFPLLQGESVASLDWTERHWCAPVVSWHHMDSNDIDVVWNFQQSWVRDHGWQTPYLVRHAFASFVSPRLSADHNAWDNLSQDTRIKKPADNAAIEDTVNWNGLSEAEKNATISFDNCRKQCEAKEQCLQYKYRKGENECVFGNVVRLGRAVSGEGEKDTRSGWVVDRVNKMVKKWEPCAEPSWKFNQ
ncbi:uncharacterized protein BDZ99DRAFT_454356 [Mytilinidion resinicola]|uniref:Glycosyltransferase family 31 protein n=1 Tax=Mytilinidion resinicola TaxID=574789 RepID=A0A6A6Y4G6_9PEZI|nr:uncharacterized protein BDZ99DRAFT_454356 [Mytilinidion resinicola]KAF2802687.1 hypothetical protein BDZ99DRAFT_454356 [Mytilinidion resinicola]